MLRVTHRLSSLDVLKNTTRASALACLEYEQFSLPQMFRRRKFLFAAMLLEGKTFLFAAEPQVRRERPLTEKYSYVINMKS